MNEIEKAIHRWLGESYRNIQPVLIVMHPKTWLEVVHSIMSSTVNSNIVNIKDMKNPNYKSIPVYRSEDIEENKFRIA